MFVASVDYAYVSIVSVTSGGGGSRSSVKRSSSQDRPPGGEKRPKTEATTQGQSSRASSDAVRGRPEEISKGKEQEEKAVKPKEMTEKDCHLAVQIALYATEIMAQSCAMTHTFTFTLRGGLTKRRINLRSLIYSF